MRRRCCLTLRPIYVDTHIFERIYSTLPESGDDISVCGGNCLEADE